MPYLNPNEAGMMDPEVLKQRAQADALRNRPPKDPTGMDDGFDPSTAMDAYQKFAGGGAASGQIGGGGLTSAGRAASVTGAPSSSAAGGSSFGSTATAAAPWAALAAAIIANESKQQGDGNRGNSTGEHIGDMASGKVLERDAERYLPHNTAGGAGKRALMMSTPSGATRNMKDLFKWGKGLF